LRRSLARFFFRKSRRSFFFPPAAPRWRSERCDGGVVIFFTCETDAKSSPQDTCHSCTSCCRYCCEIPSFFLFFWGGIFNPVKKYGIVSQCYLALTPNNPTTYCVRTMCTSFPLHVHMSKTNKRYDHKKNNTLFNPTSTHHELKPDL